MAAETLTIVDNRTGVEYTLPIVDGAIRATDLRQIAGTGGEGLLSFDKAANVVYVVIVRSVGTDLVEETANRSQLSRETLLGHFT